MTHKARKVTRERRPAASRPEMPAEAEEELPEIVDRPDGYYWATPDGRWEFGPFESHESAQSHRDAVGDEALGPGETLQEAEHEIGMNDWIDAETGLPAEGQSPPHLREE